jgi:hypothetical protein
VLLRLLTTIVLVSFLCTSALHISKSVPIFPSADKTSLVTNEAFIRGLYHEEKVDDPISVFRHVFSAMENEVSVYPTENYYYFESTLKGTTIKGNIGLPADRRDDGIVSFSYEEESAIEDTIHPPLEKEVDLKAQDGVHLTKVNDFKYTISFDGKTVIFNLNNVGISPPEKASLCPDETFVGPSFDESGLQFYLIYSEKCHSLFWVLNEDNFVPEQFLSHTPVLLIGRRTEFALYNEKDNNRKILIGVKKENVIRNNWYDGPFDQLPDNYIKTGMELRKYVEASYPYTRGKIDKYGIFLNDRDVRVAIAPYLQYSSKYQLANLLNSLRASSRSKSDFFCRLTKAR